MAKMAWTFPAGQIHKEVTSITLVNNTAKTVDHTVPAGKVWKLHGIKATNPDDVNRGIDFVVYKEAAKTNEIELLTSQTVLTVTRLQWPNHDDQAQLKSNVPHEVIMEAGNTLSIVWATGGVSTGATDADGLVVQYQEVAVSA